MRIEKENNWLSPSKIKQNHKALVTGEIPEDEIEFRRDKSKIEKDLFRLEVLENIIKDDKDQDKILLDSLK